MNDIANIVISNSVISHAADDLMSALERLVRSHRELEKVRAEKHNLTVTEVRFLLCFSHEKYLTVKGLASCLGLVKSRVSKIADGLERKYLLTRTSDPCDGRICLLSLTKEGAKRLEALNSCCKDNIGAILNKLGIERSETLSGVLKEIAIQIEGVSAGNQ